MMQCSITPDELDKLMMAYVILGRLGDETAMPNPRPGYDGPLLDHYVDLAMHHLALTLIRFDARRWRGTGPWSWPYDVPPPVPSEGFFQRLLEDR